MGPTQVLVAFITNIVGFLLLLFVLKKTAWRPIVELLDRRREEITSGYAKIDDMQKELDALKSDYENRLRGIEEMARDKTSQAVEEGRKAAAEIQETARAEAEKTRRQSEQNIALKLNQARAQLRADVVELVVGATRQLLSDRVDAGVDRQLVEGYVDRLSEVKRN